MGSVSRPIGEGGAFMAHRCVVPRFLWRPQLLTRFQGLSAAKVWAESFGPTCTDFGSRPPKRRPTSQAGKWARGTGKKAAGGVSRRLSMPGVKGTFREPRPGGRIKAKQNAGTTKQSISKCYTKILPLVYCSLPSEDPKMTGRINLGSQATISLLVEVGHQVVPNQTPELPEQWR
jgi:hypothetical protein